ncbi:MAG: class I SAM-dependent methyltransferase [Deltaproteobacteria bacterium]|nr:class I SAM-dependent methyltransferase [Deltaproteobacteria bacterium]
MTILRAKDGQVRLWAFSLGVVILLFSGCTSLKKWAYEGFNRDKWQKPDEVIRALKIRPGDQIADVGSGSGYFTFRLAKAVLPGGRVFAADVDEGLNQYVADEARRQGLGNVQVILARPEDPQLPKSGTDLAFTCNTYHHIENRVSYFSNFRKYLRPNGRIAIIDFNGKGWFATLWGHYTPADVVKEELKQAGYELRQEFDFLPRQHFLIFAMEQGG